MHIDQAWEDLDLRTQETDLTFGVLGPLEVRTGDGLLHVGGPQIRALLALLLVRPGHVISLSTLVASLWSSDAPPSAERTARTYMSRLRLALAPVTGRSAPGPLIVTTPPGYLLRTDPLSVDASLFEQLALAGRRALTRNDPFTARSHLRNALRLWRGDAFAEFADVPVLRAEAIRLEELRLSAVENRLQAELRIGMGPDLVAELDGLVAAHPLRERLWVQFMTALYRSGRQAEALSAYQRARALLADELGLEPSVELADTHRRILAQDPKLLPATVAVLSGSPAVATAVREREASPPGNAEPEPTGHRRTELAWIEPDLSVEAAVPAPPTEEWTAPEEEWTAPEEEWIAPEEEWIAPEEDRNPSPAMSPAMSPRWSRRVPARLRPAASLISEALSRPGVRALAAELGRGLVALGRAVAGLASAVSTRVHGWSGWRAGGPLADLKRHRIELGPERGLRGLASERKG
jgi:DNA-binding SARP family transcriptional activator